MSINISNEKRNDLLNKIKQIESYLEKNNVDNTTSIFINYLNEIKNDILTKKYGIVYEEHKDDIDKILDESLPVLTEKREFYINNGKILNFLIEGDNLFALNILERTHRGKIDLIYIDPPYNTGNKDFMYDDSFVSSDDLFIHSKWLSFMNSRLKYAYNLLSENGLLYISINDKECYPLKMLCDEIFGYENFISDIAVELSPSSGVKRAHKTKGYIKNRESILVYAKNNVNIKPLYDKWTEYDIHYNTWFDGKKLTTLYPLLKLTFPQYKKLNSKMYLFFDDVYNFIVKNSQYIYRSHDASKWAIENEQKGEVLYEDDKFIIKKVFNPKDDNQFELLKSKNNKTSFERMEPLSWNVVDNDIKTLRGDLWLDFDKDMGNVSKEGNVKFPNGKKPVRLLTDIIKSSTSKDSIVLDFFAGSGTTGHAVMEVNKLDNGNRKFILCTNNQNNICKKITHKRLNNVIHSENYDASLKYFCIDFLSIKDKMYYEYSDQLLPHLKEMIELEKGIELDNINNIIILNEDELDEFSNNIPSTCEAIYIAQGVSLTYEQKMNFKELNIKINIIPDYYYKEMY